MSDTSVRTARPPDVPAVAHVQAAVWREAYGDLVDPEVRDAFLPEAFEPTWRESLKSPPSPLHRLLVATEGQQVVGFAAIGPLTTDTEDLSDPQNATANRSDGEIYALGVDPANRRHGNGSRLLNAAVDTLRAGDFESVTTWALADDESVRAFLTAAGLQPDGAWRDRVIAADGRTAREVRLTASLVEPDPAAR